MRTIIFSLATMAPKSFVVGLMILAVAGHGDGSDFDRKLKKMENRINNRMNDMEENIKSMKQNIADLEFENQELKTELKREKNRSDDLETKLESALSRSSLAINVDRELKEINDRINSMQKNFEQNSIHFGEENRALRKELDKHSNRIDELEKKLESALVSSPAITDNGSEGRKDFV
ncbi:MAG: hypothetical protein AB2693_15690 [Candidatus Thiodiazotropha sp.]